MSEQVYSYYPGCSLHSSAKEYDISTRLVCEALGIELRELEDWICCGASSAHTTSDLLGLALPAQNLKIAEKEGLPVVIPCAMCFSRMKYAIAGLKDNTTKNEINKVLQEEMGQPVAVESLLKILDGKTVPIPVVKPLAGLKVACYYGCLLVRPLEVANLDNVENPQMMDELMQTLGAESIDWDFKTECCGAGLPLARPDMVLKLSYQILAQAKSLGADCVAVACPMCHSNLDMQQKRMKSEDGERLDLPVLYFTELIGLALGLSAKDLVLKKHFIDPLPMLEEKGLL
jgi:heterodisulfide reductase subunit B